MEAEQWTAAKPVQNDPKLMAATKVRSRGGFCVRGVPVSIDTVIEVPFHVARDLEVLGKCEII